MEEDEEAILEAMDAEDAAAEGLGNDEEMEDKESSKNEGNVEYKNLFLRLQRKNLIFYDLK